MGTLIRDGNRWVVINQKNCPLSPLAPLKQRQNNRCPLESPPVAKKLQKIKEGERYFGHTFINLSPSSSSSSSSSRSMEGKENRSILKRSGKLDVVRNSNNNNNNRQTIKSGRRVDFDQDVLVYHFDRVEGSHVHSERQQLNEEPTKDRREYVARVLNGKNYKTFLIESSSINNHPPPNGKRSLFGGSREPPIQYAEPVQIVQQQTPTTTTSTQYQENIRQIPIERIYPLHSSSSSFFSSSPPSLSITSSSFSIPSMDQKRTTQPPSLSSSSILILDSQGRDTNSQDEGTNFVGEADFSFFEDEFHRLRLKFTIPLGEGVAANDVLVKANTTGNKVRLVGTRTIGTDRYGTIRQEFTERYQLPMEVDPYTIAARLDNNGTLFVEAPVMTADRKRALAIERQTQIGNMSDFVI